jgi:hypothetical protein
MHEPQRAVRITAKEPTMTDKTTSIREWLDARESREGRCVAHPAYDADYCPICGTARVISTESPVV